MLEADAAPCSCLPAPPSPLPRLSPARSPTVFPMAKAGPRMAHVTANIAGSVTGEESQNAMMGASGTPAARNPVISGSTVTPQTGVTEPIADATTIVEAGRPSNHFAVTAPAPLAATHADRTSPIAIIGATARKLSSTKRTSSWSFRPGDHHGDRDDGRRRPHDRLLQILESQCS